MSIEQDKLNDLRAELYAELTEAIVGYVTTEPMTQVLIDQTLQPFREKYPYFAFRWSFDPDKYSLEVDIQYMDPEINIPIEIVTAI